MPVKVGSRWRVNTACTGLEATGGGAPAEGVGHRAPPYLWPGASLGLPCLPSWADAIPRCLRLAGRPRPGLGARTRRQELLREPSPPPGMTSPTGVGTGHRGICRPVRLHSTSRRRPRSGGWAKSRTREQKQHTQHPAGTSHVGLARALPPAVPTQHIWAPGHRSAEGAHCCPQKPEWGSLVYHGL